MSQSYFSTGTLQKDRANQMLLPSYVNADEKTTSDFLVFIQQYAQLVRYWNTQNNPQSNWVDFFQDDLSILLAFISFVDTSQYPIEHNVISTEFHNTPLEYDKEDTLVKLLLLNLKISGLIEDWYTKIVAQGEQNDQNSEIEQLFIELVRSNISNESLRIKSCYHNMKYFFQQSPDTIAQQDLSKKVEASIDFYKKVLNQSIVIYSNVGIDQLDNYAAFFNYLDKLYQSLYGTISLLQEAVPSYFEQSLTQNNHSPHISLMLAFWEMMGQTTQLMNQFTATHLNFYYQDVLQQQYASSTPDQVLLYFSLSPTSTQTFIPAGTSFLAGASPSGQPLLYALDKDLTVNQAQPVGFKTLFNGTTNSSIGSISPNLIYASPEANSGDGLGGSFQQIPASWPTLGKNLDNVDAPNLAQLGFAISNPILFLSEGNRQITVVLKLSNGTINTLKQDLIQVGIDELDYWESLELLINQSFSVRYTGSKGWVTPSEINSWLIPIPAETTNEKDTIGIAFFINVNSTQPAVSAYNSAIHGAGYATNDPMLKFNMAQQVKLKKSDLTDKISKKSTWGKKQISLNPYLLLSKITIKEIPIYVEVEGIKNFSVQNDFSLLNPKKPFAPFGVTPVVNNHFYLGNNEVFCKNLTFLGLNLQWFDLPQFPNGFYDYYSGYNLFQPDKPFYNSVFKWKLDLLTSASKEEENKWEPLNFSGTLNPLKPTLLPPDNPSVPKFNQDLYDDLEDDSLEQQNITSMKEGEGELLKDIDQQEKVNPANLSVPPLTSDIANAILDALSKYYGDQWNKTRDLPKENNNKKTDNTDEPIDVLTPQVAEEILKNLGQLYNPDSKTNNSSTKGNQSDNQTQNNKTKQSNHSLYPNVALGILKQLGGYYGDNWTNNNPPPTNNKPKNPNQPPPSNKSLTPKVAGDILNNVGNFYGPNWIENNPAPKGKEPQNQLSQNNNNNSTGSNQGLTPDVAADILSNLGQHYGDTWAKNNPPPAVKLTKKLIAQNLAKAIIKITTPTSSGKGSKGLANQNNAPSKDPADGASSQLENDIFEVTNPLSGVTLGNAIGSLPTTPPPNQNQNPDQNPPKNIVHQKIDKHVGRVKKLMQGIEDHLLDSDKKKKLLGKFESLAEERIGKATGLSNLSKIANLAKKGFSLFKKLPTGGKIPFLNIPFLKNNVIGRAKKLLGLGHKDDSKKLPLPKQGNITNDNPPKDPAPGGTPNGNTPGGSPKGNTPAPAPASKPPIEPSEAGKGKLNSKTNIFINDFKNINWKKMAPPTPFSAKTVYNNETQDGFLRFTLTSPNYAFGEAEYPQVVAATANYNMEMMAYKLENKIQPAAATSSPIIATIKPLMTSIDTFLADPYLKIIDSFPGEHIQELYKNALTGQANINALINSKKKVVTVKTSDLESYFDPIVEFVYVVGVVLFKFESILAAESKQPRTLPKFFKSVYHDLSILKPFSKVLLASHPGIAAGLKIFQTVAKLHKSDENTPAGSSDIKDFITNYNKALSDTKTIEADIAAAYKKEAELQPINSTTGTSLKPLLPPRPAYIPKIAKINANYSAKDKITLKSKSGNNPQFFHIHPFGISAPVVTSNKMELLPNYDQEGYLFIAIEKVVAPEIITLLFEVNAESGNRDLPLPALKWSYLDNGAWIDFLDSSVKDGTNGFSQSGVISFYLPLLQNNTTNLFIDKKLTGDYYWLRATTAENAAAVCEIIQVYAQAGTASYSSGDIDPAHFNAVLPANKISKFQQPNPAIAKIHQPLVSFGGKAAEDQTEFYTRVNERLRHKDRAICSWDYEHLVLQQFPNVSFVRCLNHVSLTQSMAPGNVTVLILPKTNPTDTISLSPKTDQGLIGQVSQFIENLSDPTIQVHVRNPQYQYLKIILELILTPGLDPGHYLKVLNELLVNEITPWSDDALNVNPFETTISYFSLLELINRQSYVEEVVTFQLNLLNATTDSSGKKIKEGFQKIEPKQPWIIISSLAQHDLSVITEEQLMLRGAIPKTSSPKKQKPKKTKTKTKQSKNKSPNGTSQNKSKKGITKNNALSIGNDLYE